MSAPSVVDFYSPPHSGLDFGVKNKAHPNGHSGKDYNGWASGTIIPSPFAGIVVGHIRSPKDLGNVVVVEVPALGWFSVCHLVSFDGAPAVGASVRVGTGLGPLGNTGYSFGNHVHTMLSTTSNNPVTRRGITDPEPYIDAVRASILAGDDPHPIDPSPATRKDPDMPTFIQGANIIVWPNGFANVYVWDVFEACRLVAEDGDTTPSRIDTYTRESWTAVDFLAQREAQAAASATIAALKASGFSVEYDIDEQAIANAVVAALPKPPTSYTVTPH